MYWNEPKKGDVVYEYVPQNLNSHRKCWIEHKWQDLEYFKMRLKAGLIYTDFEELEFRISFEKSMYHRTNYIAHKYSLSKLVVFMVNGNKKAIRSGLFRRRVYTP